MTSQSDELSANFFLQESRTGLVRIANEGARDSILERRDTDGCVPVGEVKIKLAVLEGDEEKDFYVRASLSHLKIAKSHLKPKCTFDMRFKWELLQ